MEIVLQWWQLLILILFAQIVVLVVLSILRPSVTDDEAVSYYMQLAFMANSLLTDEQKIKLEKMMEYKDEIL